MWVGHSPLGGWRGGTMAHPQETGPLLSGGSHPFPCRSMSCSHAVVSLHLALLTSIPFISLTALLILACPLVPDCALSLCPLGFPW